MASYLTLTLPSYEVSCYYREHGKLYANVCTKMLGKQGDMATHIVTGGAGFIGQELINQLIKREHFVIVIDPLAPSVELIESSNLKIRHIRGSVLDQELLLKAFKNADTVHHLAAAVPLTRSKTIFDKLNVEGTKLVYQVALRSGVRHFNFMSSSAVYGEVKKYSCPVKEEAPTRPFEAYGNSKLLAEHVILEGMKNSTAMSSTIFRPRTVIGPGRIGIFELLFNWILFNKPVYFLGDGSNLFQLVHSEDVALACLLSAESGISGIFNLGTDRFGTLRDLIFNLLQHAGSKSKIFPVPVAFAQFGMFALDVVGFSPLSSWHYRTSHLNCYFDISKARQFLNWTPRYSNDEMLNSAYDWYVNNRLLLKENANASIHKRPLKRGFLNLLMK